MKTGLKAKKCKERFGARARVIPSGNIWLDMILPGVSKEGSLQMLLASFGIQPENGIAFGDQTNDVEMLRMAGIGCAVAGASQCAVT